jgi:hypothetical protein
MSAKVIQLRDFQNPKDIERMQRELEKEAKAILAETVPYGGAGIDGMTFTAPDKDSA